MTMRRHGVLDQSRKRHAIERLAGGKFGDLRENLAAALRLLTQQFHVIGIRRVRLERAFNFAHHHGDGGERRAKFMSRRGGKSVELREVLLARQHKLRRRQRIRKLARLLGDLPRIDADITDRQQRREPHADNIGFRKLQRLFALPGELIVEEDQHRRAQHGKNPEQQSHARRQCCRRDQDRSQQQEGKRVLQPAGEIQERRKLRDVEAQQKGGAVGLKPSGLGEADLKRDVEQRRQRDHRKARPDRNVELEAEMHDQDGHDLPEDGKPTQPHQRVEPHVSWPVTGPWQTEHAANVAIGESLSK